MHYHLYSVNRKADAIGRQASLSISLRSMLDSHADGISGWIVTVTLRSSGPEEDGYSSQLVS